MNSKRITISMAVVALAATLSACGSSSDGDTSSRDARTSACRLWTINGAPAAKSVLKMAQTDEVDTAEANRVLERLHDEFTRVAQLEGLSDADFKPFAGAAKVAPTTVDDIFQLRPENPEHGELTSALKAIDQRCASSS